jgi:hypothetical protein
MNPRDLTGGCSLPETLGIGNLRHAALSPLQISLHLLRILVSLGQSGPGFRDALLGKCLQILKFALFRIQ